tara:strand:- start:1890 stop:2321 length:432 start_codon:yes stop_codon:yes gene_type:complete
MLYKIFLVLHIISFISWMAGMFYLPRIFVYHSQKEVGSESSETFKVMEEKLMKIIMNPALIATWFFGLVLVGISGFEIFSELWLQIKILMVVAMSGCHGFFAKTVKNFANDQRPNSEKFYRYINELPTILLIIIIILVIFKPI